MWRRAVSSQLQTLTSSSNQSASRIASVAAHRSFVTTSPAASISFLARDFSSVSESVPSESGKRAEDIPPIASGHQREELQAEIEGRDILEKDHLVGPFGTKEEPAVVKSIFDRRVVGCPGGEGEDKHDVVWFWLEKDKPHECPVCSQYFVLEVVGTGGDPYARPSDGKDEEHH